MSKKYIAQNNIPNFVYPNNNLPEYDVEIIHNLKENSVSGNTSGFSILYDGSTGNLNLSFTYQWYLNNAEPFITAYSKLNIISVHLMTNEKQYYKPWICIGYIQRNSPSLTYVTDTQNFVITPAMVGQTSFSTGTYYAEIRFIGHRAIFPINYSANVVTTTPYPTPSMTATHTPTPTPTATPNNTPNPTPTPSATPGGGTYTSIGTGSGSKVNPTTCSYVSAMPTIYLDSVDYAIYISNGGCLSNGINTISYIRNSDGSLISGTFYFTYFGDTCSTTTFKSTNGAISINPTQC